MTLNAHLLCEHLANDVCLGDTIPNAWQEDAVKILKEEFILHFYIF